MPSLSPPCPAGASAPLLVTAEPRLLDDVLRLAAAAGIDPEVSAEPHAVRLPWATSSLVIVGDDLAEAVARCRYPRRRDVVLLGVDLDDGDVWRRAVAVGADHVVFLPDAEGWIVERLGDIADGTGTDAVSVAVVGGRGGAGASTLAAALAVTAARRGLGAALIDADPLGGGLDVLLGGEGAPGLRWPDLAGTRGRVNGGSLVAALPRLHDITVLSWDRGDPADVPAPAVRSIVRAVRRRHDVVVADVPRRFDAVTQEAVAQCGTGLLVVTGDVRGIAAAAQIAARLRPALPELRVVVRGPCPSGLPPGDVAESLGLPLAGEFKAESALAAAADRGDAPAAAGRGPLARLCRDVVDEVVGVSV